MLHRIFKWSLPLGLLLAYVLPFLGVAYWSVSLPSGIGLGNYREIVDNAHIMNVMLETFQISAAATLLSVLLAYVVAHCWSFATPTGKVFIEIFVLIPFWVSALIRAFAWILVLRNDGVVNSWLMQLGIIGEPLPLVRNRFGVLVGMVHFMIPYALFPIMTSFAQVDRRLLLASRGLGAGRFRTFWEILFPLTVPGTIGAVIIVFVFCLGFYVTPAILGGGSVIMIAEYIYQQLFQLPNWGLAAALSVAMVIIVAVLLKAVNLLGGSSALPRA